MFEYLAYAYFMFECLRPALFEMSSGARTCLKVCVFEYLAAIRYIDEGGKEQCFLLGDRNIAYVTPRIIYLQYQNICFLDQSIPKKN